MTRRSQRAIPAIEGLEGRQLLAAAGTNPLNLRAFAYRTATGAKVTIELRGNGNLNGTNVDSGGDLNLVYGATNAQSKIFAYVSGGSAPLLTVKEASLDLTNNTGIGGQILGAFIAPGLDLVTDGMINMTSGVGRVQLRSIAANSEIHLRDLPQTFAATLTTSTGSTITLNNVSASGGSGGGINVGGSSVVLTGNPTGTTALGQSTNIATFIASQTFVLGGNSNPVTVPPGQEAVTPLSQVSTTTPTSYTWAGRTQTYSNNSNGSTTLTGVTGVFTPTENLISTPNPANPGPNPQPPGVLIQVGAVIGTGGTIGAGQIYGYDPVKNALIEFNTVTGGITNTIPVGGTPTNAAGVGLGRIDRELVVLLARGTTVQVFNATTGAPLGSFSTSSLASLGFNGADGVAYTGTATVLSDSAASVPVQPKGPTDFGLAVAIDVKSSLAKGVAVTAGSTFITENGFSFGGDATGVPGTTNVYEYGAALFNAFEAPFRQAGILSIAGMNNGSPSEASRTSISNPQNAQGNTPFINYAPSGPLTGLAPAIGSIENLLAIDQGVSKGTNVLKLVSPFNLSSQGSLSLQDADPVVALSETFHPELTGSALVDVQGNVQSFTANSAQGMVLNVQGNMDLVQIGTTTNSTIIAEPLSHVQMPRRAGTVLVLSNTRAIGTRNDVTLVPSLRSLGTLRLPN